MGPPAALASGGHSAGAVMGCLIPRPLPERKGISHRGQVERRCLSSVIRLLVRGSLPSALAPTPPHLAMMLPSTQDAVESVERSGAIHQNVHSLGFCKDFADLRQGEPRWETGRLVWERADIGRGRGPTTAEQDQGGCQIGIESPCAQL